MPVTKAKFENFAAFKDLEVEFSPGINALVGENGTGKTHLMKACYAACHAANPDDFALKLVRVFLPTGKSGGGLVRQSAAVEYLDAEVLVNTQTTSFGVGIDSEEGVWVIHSPDAPDSRADVPARVIYIPVKEMLANAPGFRSLYELREIYFEDVYYDILQRAYLPALREPIDDTHRQMLERIEGVIGGKVTVRGEEFFLSNEQGDLEFTLLAEGWRKLGLLWLLIRNGTLREGSVLFWDEPEANLNPKMFKVVMQVLLELQRAGVQVFFATHDYVMLKELDLQMTEGDQVAFHSLYRDETGEIACHTTARYLDIHPNAIGEAFDDLYDRQIERSLGGLKR